MNETGKPARRWVRDTKLVLATIGVTSAIWLVALVLVGPDLASGPRGETASRVVETSPREIILPADEDPPIEERSVTGPPPIAVPASAGGLRIPVLGVAADQLTDTFTASRGGGERRHDAIDIMAPAGTPVIAARAGTIEKLFLSDAGGKTIYIRSPDGTRMDYYAHLAEYEPGLAEGQTVAPGDVLGTVGSSGNVDPAAPHLHFAIMAMRPGEEWWKGTALNPYPRLTGQ